MEDRERINIRGPGDPEGPLLKPNKIKPNAGTNKQPFPTVFWLGLLSNDTKIPVPSTETQCLCLHQRAVVAQLQGGKASSESGVVYGRYIMAAERIP